MFNAVPFHQDASFLIVGERTNANGSKKFRDAMLEGDWDGCVRMAREQVREGAHVLDVCVDYVGRDGTLDMDELVSRFATQVTVPLVLDSTEPPVHRGRAPAHRWPGHPQLGQPRGRRGPRAAGSTGCARLARTYGAAVICLLIDEEGQARDVRVEGTGRPPDPPAGDRALRTRPRRPHLRRPDVPALDRRRGPAPRRHAHDRGHPAHQGRAAGRLHHARRVQRQLRPLPRRPPRAQLACSCTSASRPGSTRRSCTRPGSCRSTRSPRSRPRSAST